MYGACWKKELPYVVRLDKKYRIFYSITDNLCVPYVPKKDIVDAPVLRRVYVLQEIIHSAPLRRPPTLINFKPSMDM